MSEPEFGKIWTLELSLAHPECLTHKPLYSTLTIQFVDYLLIRENKVFCLRNCATHLLFMLATSSYASRMGVLLKRNIVLNYKAILGVVRSHP